MEKHVEIIKIFFYVKRSLGFGTFTPAPVALRQNKIKRKAYII